jgi:hypothetical protein
LQRESCGCSLGSMQRHDRSPGTGLDEADRKRLAAALAGAREARVYRRLEALLLVAEAARRCRVDRSSVHRWLAQYRAEYEVTVDLHCERYCWRMGRSLGGRDWRSGFEGGSTIPEVLESMRSCGAV